MWGCRKCIVAAIPRDSLPPSWKADSLSFVVLLAEHVEPSLAVKKKRQPGASCRPTSTPKKRVWGFESIPSGRPGADLDLSWENAIGSVQFTYETASGRAGWLSRDPIAERGGINLYRYVANNPIYWIDPLGLLGNVSWCEAAGDIWTATLVGAGIEGAVGAGVGFATGEALDPAGGGIPLAIAGGALGIVNGSENGFLTGVGIVLIKTLLNNPNNPGSSQCPSNSPSSPNPSNSPASPAPSNSSPGPTGGPNDPMYHPSPPI